MNISWESLSLIFLASLVATIGYYSQTQAQRHMEISFFSPVQNWTPLVVLIIAVLFLRESVSFVQLLGIAAVVIGSTLLVHEPGSKRSFSSIWRTTSWPHIVGSVVLLGVAAVLDKWLLGGIDPETYLFFGWLFMNLCYILLDWWRYDWRHIAVDFEKGWHWLLLCGILSVLSTLVFYEALSLPETLVVLAMPLRRVAALIETLFGGSLFHENNLAWRLFASLVMLIGLVLIAA